MAPHREQREARLEGRQSSVDRTRAAVPMNWAEQAGSRFGEKRQCCVQVIGEESFPDQIGVIGQRLKVTLSYHTAQYLALLMIEC